MCLGYVPFKFNAYVLVHRWFVNHCTCILSAWFSIFYTGPIAAALSRRFSVRSVAFVGGLIMSFGVCLAGFGPNIEFMFLPISLLAGITAFS